MSWDSYVACFKGDGSTMIRCGIYDQEGNPWAISDGMCGTTVQVKNLASHYVDSSSFYAQGPDFEGSKFTFLRKIEDADGNPVLVFKRKDTDATEEEKHFLVCMNTKQACLVGVAKGGECHKAKAIALIKNVNDAMRQYGY
jgi:hypothetical protein